MRSSKDQLKEELLTLYKRMTDPEERRKEKERKEVERFVLNKKENFGL